MKVWVLTGESPSGDTIGPFVFSSQPTNDYIEMLLNFLEKSGRINISSDVDMELDLVDVIDPTVSGLLFFHD